MSEHAVSLRGLLLRIGLLITAVVLLAAVVYVVWSQTTQNALVESKVLAEARTLNTEMQSVWDYIDDSQAAINTNVDGTYDFKGIYCSIAGKGIAKRFTRQSNDYVIRYVRENSRSGTDEPDAFERRALNHFTVGGSNEYYEMTTWEGESVFRYSSVLRIRPNCLACHGEPAGTPDETGFLREGMQLDDVAGAVSIVIPLDTYQAESRTTLVNSCVFFVVLAAIIVTVLFFAMHRWIARPLERSNRRLEDESQQKSDFLATMSHELRTPLSSIIAFTDIWEKSHAAEDTAERRLVEEIKQNSTVLLSMVNNTIDVAKLEAGRLSVQCTDVDLVDVVGVVFSVAEPLAIKENISLSHAVDPEIPFLRTDGEAVRKIIVNLVSNALKYTAAGGTVAVEARTAPEGDGVVVRVSDTGCGIREEDFGAIFQKFDRPGAADEAPISGSGLGLYLVKSLTERLGGTVCVESEVGRGSVFTVSLPLRSPACNGEREQGK
ncbi:DUF3365 domain-containing protein [uncultured Adlercreutzia sp.]|uniref:ATP-binding protein n=1 Tax=uncultured Adlercreutzia sp. TaxID=875803 RepID=UPI0026F3AA59|nr:DUF3365 domain-containing protein [uncultured Adlercreutzia sp.]